MRIPKPCIVQDSLTGEVIGRFPSFDKAYEELYNHKGRHLVIKQIQDDKQNVKSPE